ncbi:PAS domain-containing sensor histidine kinase [Kiloniella majae]|uniref:PAS domain-containing sensor histidine kinase n=1 Tax=Kiloniella majae TaxID=1938558 RepID=UPI000A277014|nr:PAS domain-containing hybrid sensor histidine kinase/response regulator [Kiloniella majae]
MSKAEQAPATKNRKMMNGFLALCRSKLSTRIAITVFMSILIVEAAILVPSYNNFKRDLLARLADTGQTAVITGFQNHVRSILGNGGAEQENPLITGEKISRITRFKGGSLYDEGGEKIGSFGEVPELSLTDYMQNQEKARLNNDETRYDTVWLPQETGLPFVVISRLDASWIAAELTAFTWRIVGLVLLISVSISVVALVFLGRMVLNPLLELRGHLVRAQEDPGNTDRVAMSGTLIKNEFGEMVTALNVLLTRVSDLRVAERATNEQRFTDFANSASDWFWETDQDLNITMVSDGFPDIPGVSTKDMVGKSWKALKHDRIRVENLDSYLDVMAQEGCFRDMEFSYICKEDRQHYQSLSANPYYNNDGSFAGYRGTGRDISISYIAEKKLREAKVQAEKAQIVAEEANKAKSQFLTNMSHELRTPLNAINGFSEVIIQRAQQKDDDKHYADFAQDIYQSGNRLLEILNDILDLSRIEADAMELSEDTFDVKSLIGFCKKEMAETFERENLEKAITFSSVKLDDDIYLNADAKKLKQVLHNLLSNAVKFNKEDGEVHFNILEEETGDVCFEIRDTGIGIAEEDLSAVLKPFKQANGQITRQHEGTGLGLAISAALVELHDGSFRIESQEGIGTSVKFSLPITRRIKIEDGQMVAYA